MRDLDAIRKRKAFLRRRAELRAKARRAVKLELRRVK